MMVVMVMVVAVIPIVLMMVVVMVIEIRVRVRIDIPVSVVNWRRYGHAKLKLNPDVCGFDFCLRRNFRSLCGAETGSGIRDWS